MRRIDVIGVGFATFLVGGGVYLILQWMGLDSLSAGVWSQLFLVIGLIVWVLTYLFRALTKNMTYNQQLKDYEEAVLQKRLDELTPEQVAELQAEIERERSLGAVDEKVAASQNASDA